jgi:hypothetical protein
MGLLAKLQAERDGAEALRIQLESEVEKMRAEQAKTEARRCPWRAQAPVVLLRTTAVSMLDPHKVGAPRFENILKGLQQLPRRVSQLMLVPVQFLDQGDLAGNASLPLPDMALGLSKSILGRVHAFLQSGHTYGKPPWHTLPR